MQNVERDAQVISAVGTITRFCVRLRDLIESLRFKETIDYRETIDGGGKYGIISEIG